MASLGLRIPLVALTALLYACQPKIGDPCVRGIDCSIRGERLCDLSQTQYIKNKVQGECTIEACNRDTCPKEAVCVKVYGSRFLSVACDPEREDVAVPDPNASCGMDVCPALPPRDDCKANEICLPEGLCADEVAARMSCRRRCKKDGDCRAGYRCIPTGARGIYLAPDPANPTRTESAKICAPEP